jgi:Tfp pilus assembly protein PilZ
MFNISLGGLFIETEDFLSIGERIQITIFLPDKERDLDVTGEVIWVRREEELTP